MYLTSKEELQRAVSKRLAERDTVRERRAAFLEKQYGLDHMPDILPKSLRQQEEGRPVAFLARQLASICMEDIAFEVCARALDMRPVTITFTRDAFSSRNHDKMRRIEVPWLEWTPKGIQQIEYERVVTRKSVEIDRMPLSAIECGNGDTLPDFHQRLRKAARLRGVTYDISPVHTYALMNARKSPTSVYRLEGRKEKRHELLPDEKPRKDDRPPSEWYYPYYLSWFLDGESVLFETYDNPIGEVSQAKQLFEECMRSIEAATGYLPLIVKVPALSEEMLRCNRHLLWRNDALPALAEYAAHADTSDTVAFFAAAAETAMQFR